MRSLWEEPAVSDPPARVWRDWLLVAVILVVAVVEVFVRPDITWRPLAFTLCVLLAFTLLWRRTHPLPVVLVVFGVMAVVELAARNSGTPPFGLYTMAFGLVLPYALCRWASGRDVVIGVTFILAAHVIRQVAIGRPSDLLVGFAFLLTSAALGIAVRSIVGSRRRQVEQYRLLEREQLARELHDTVAHHMSAIAIQAQAAQAVGSADPQVASDALRTIESEATRALTEMRAMVGALREVSSPSMAPQRGVADLGLLTSTGADTPRIEVSISGSVAGLSPFVDAAIFRIAQESVTNALRHARQATRIAVTVMAEPDLVRLDVTDDGEHAPAARQDAGFGLVGMAERVALLDGTFEAGPRPDRGWTVSAVLPRTGGRA